MRFIHVYLNYKNALTTKQQNVSLRRLSYRKTIGRIADHPLDSPRASVAEAVHRLMEFSKRSNEFFLISILTACIITLLRLVHAISVQITLCKQQNYLLHGIVDCSEGNRSQMTLTWPYNEISIGATELGRVKL